MMKQPVTVVRNTLVTMHSMKLMIIDIVLLAALKMIDCVSACQTHPSNVGEHECNGETLEMLLMKTKTMQQAQAKKINSGSLAE